MPFLSKTSAIGCFGSWRRRPDRHSLICKRRPSSAALLAGRYKGPNGPESGGVHITKQCVAQNYRLGPREWHSTEFPFMNQNSQSITSTIEMARNMRMHALRMVHRAGASHIASALSICDIVAVLYGRSMRVSPQKPRDPDRDRFILSKGHACVAVYAALAERGFFPFLTLNTTGPTTRC